MKGLFRAEQVKQQAMIKAALRHHEEEEPRPQKRQRAMPALGDVDEEEEDWTKAIQDPKRHAKPRAQRAHAPIDGRKWSKWTASDEHARKLVDTLGLQLPGCQIEHKSILDIAELIGEDNAEKRP